MNRTFLTLSLIVGLLSVSNAQAPKDWARTTEKKVLTREGIKLTHYGQWTNSEGTQVATATGMPRIADL